MIILNNDQKSLELILAGNASTAPLEWTCSFSQVKTSCCCTSTCDCITKGELQGTIEDATPVVATICLPPDTPSSANDTIVKEIEFISVLNTDSATSTVTIQIDNGGTKTRIISAVLPVGYSIIYNRESGFTVYSTAGAVVSMVTSVNAIEIGDVVTGGTAKALLFTNASGDLDNCILKEESDGITIPEGKIIRSETTGKGQLDLCEAGVSVFLSTDQGAGAESFLRMNDTSFSLVSLNGNVDSTPTALQINHDDDIAMNVGNAIAFTAPNVISLVTPVVFLPLYAADTVPYIDSSNLLVASAVTPTELGYLSGVTSAIQTQINAKAPLASPALTGTPTAPTAATGTNTTQVATTAFVQQEITAASLTTKLVPTTDQTTTVVTAGNITGLSMSVAINSVYEIDWHIHVGCNNTGGVKLTTTFPAGATEFIGVDLTTTSNLVYAYNSLSISGTLMATAACQENNANRMIKGKGTLTTGGTAGTFQVQFASGTATQTSTVYKEGTVVTLTKIA